MQTRPSVPPPPQGLPLRWMRGPLVSVAVLSAFLNVLVLGGSVYLMLVYDSVLPSHSIPTLVGLFAMVALIYGFQMLLEQMRQKVLFDIGAELETRAMPRVQYAMTELALHGHAPDGDGLTPMRDLDAVRQWLSSTGPATLIDIPWILFFLAIICLLHPLLALTALAGALVLLALTVLTDRLTRGQVQQLSDIAGQRGQLASTRLAHVELLTALGMSHVFAARFARINEDHATASEKVARSIALMGGLSRTLRQFLQSCLITVGALLVIKGVASGGVIFAASILSTRALAPIDQIIGNWQALGKARLGWTRLQRLMQGFALPQPPAVSPPLPHARLDVAGVCVAPPRSQTLTVAGVDFALAAGQSLGIIGASGSGKSSLARALVGVWPAARGSLRLDGATYDAWDRTALGRAMGYLPQTVELFEGTVAQNIARFCPDMQPEAVIAAARAAGAHDLIMQLPKAYQTDVGPEGMALSAGQRQRVGLARALYGAPFLIVLDEPNSNLDTAGEQALGTAIAALQKRGAIAIVITHRPGAIAALSHLLVMDKGRGVLFGPREEVLRRLNTRPAPAPANTPAHSPARPSAPPAVPLRAVPEPPRA